MADRVHPTDSPQVTGESAAKTPSTAPVTPSTAEPAAKTPSTAEPAAKPTHPVPQKSAETYVVQVPKDQIYRYPPPENARRYQSLTGRRSRRGCFCRCFCWTLALFFLLLVLLAVASGILYLVFRPEAPNYSVDDVSVRSLNLTSPSPLSTQVDVTIRARNPNDKLGIYYVDGSSVEVYYSDVSICSGTLPVFFQPTNNVTVFRAALRGSNVVLGGTLISGLRNAERRKRVPLSLNVKVPVRIQVGSVRTWKITVKVNCEVTVDSLTAASSIISKTCDYKVELW